MFVGCARAPKMCFLCDLLLHNICIMIRNNFRLCTRIGRLLHVCAPLFSNHLQKEFRDHVRWNVLLLFAFCHIYIYIYIHIYPVALRAAPATAPGMGPRTMKTTEKGIRNLVKIVKNWCPGGSRRLLGEVLGAFWFQGAPGDEKESKTDLRTPPPGSQLGNKFWLFVDSVGFFPVVFLNVVLAGVRVQF